MDDFVQAEFEEPDRRKIKALAKTGNTSMNQVRKAFDRLRNTEKVYINSTYQVNVQEIETEIGDMLWLSIKRRDKKTVHDWRDLQEIKNKIVGPEFEGVELYPAESRKVDTSNQYHIWVLASGMRFPFGYKDREVVDGNGEIGKDGTRQRPFGSGDF